MRTLIQSFINTYLKLLSQFQRKRISKIEHELETFSAENHVQCHDKVNGQKCEKNQLLEGKVLGLAANLGTSERLNNRDHKRIHGFEREQEVAVW